MESWVKTLILNVLLPLAFVFLNVFIIFRKETSEAKEELAEFFSNKFYVKVVFVIQAIAIAGFNSLLIYTAKTNYNTKASNFQPPYLAIAIIDVFLCVVAFLIVYLLIKYKYSANATNSSIDQMNLVMNNDPKAMPLKTMDCVFSVSAIAIKDCKFLLVKRQYSGDMSKWIQPGSYYRTNRVFRSGDDTDDQFGKVDPPYDYLVNQLIREANICNEDQFKLLDFSSFGIKSTIPTSELSELTITTGKNKVSPAPFLVQFEEAMNPKSSGKKIHIDLFYAFELQSNYSLEKAKQASFTNQVKYTDINFFSIQDIRNLANNEEIYPDLYVVCTEFLKYYRKAKFLNTQIRNCTFNNNNMAILLRLGESCNLSCYYCIRRPEINAGTTHTSSVPTGVTEEVKTTLDERNDKQKLIISGGEPFIYENSIVQIINICKENYWKISKISICTNSVLWSPFSEKIKELNELCQEHDIALKFVVGLSWFDDTTFTEMTCSQTGWDEVIKFISFLNSNKISFEISAIMTQHFKNNMERYVNFWNRIEAKNVSLSYGCRNSGENARKLLSKEECIKYYNILLSGSYPTERFDSFELLLPDCDNSNCLQGSNIKCIYYDSAKNAWQTSTQCLEKRQLIQK